MTDEFGNDIKPGDLIAYATQYKGMRFGVVMKYEGGRLVVISLAQGYGKPVLSQHLSRLGHCSKLKLSPGQLRSDYESLLVNYF